jgi:alkylhydroperoxidase family enzyme
MDPMERYLEKVRERAYTITDADVDALREAGYSEDEIFERTVAVAVEEGRRRIAAAEKVIG